MSRPTNNKKKKDPRDLVLAKKPYTLTVNMVMDSELTERAEQIDRELASLDRQLRLASAGKGNEERIAKIVTESQALLDELDEIESGIEEVTVGFKLKSIPRAVYTKMMREHPPTQEQLDVAAEEVEKVGKTAADAKLNVNADTFPPALVCRALVEPKLTEEEVASMWDPENEQWNTTELTILYHSAERACQSISLPR